jgi:hypothetical protein
MKDYEANFSAIAEEKSQQTRISASNEHQGGPQHLGSPEGQRSLADRGLTTPTALSCPRRSDGIED